jgi:Icc-related predicted phosphoesterase
MQIALFSDTHAEFQKWNPPSVPDADVIVIAGDLGATPDHFSATLVQMRQANPEKPVIVVLGNHEFYKGPPLNSRRIYRTIAESHGVELLDNTSTLIDGVLFVGGTMWTYVDASGEVWMADRMNDYHCISWATGDNGRLDNLSTHNVTSEHRQTRHFVLQTLHANWFGAQLPTVVVTHHAPSHQSAETDVGHYKEMQDFYCSDFTKPIKQYRPVAWLHGHIHSSSDYMIGTTRVVCNPRGYGPNHFNPDFQPLGARIIV